MRKVLVLGLAVLAVGLIAVGQASLLAGGGRPSLSMTAVPMIGVAPVKMIFRVTLKGGADDDPEFYCAAVEWDWDDGSISESKRDCDPYEKGKSLIQRHFTAEHEYKESSMYRVTFRLKQRNKTVASTSLQITVS